MNLEMFVLQKQLHILKTQHTTPQKPNPSAGFGFVFKPTTPTPIPKVKPAV